MYLTDEAAQVLAELAFSATENGISEGLKPIFELLTIIYPKNASGYVGLAWVAINKNKDIEALNYLDPHGLYAEVNAEMAWALRLFLLRKRDGPSVNNYVLQEAESFLGPELIPEVIEMADELMGTIDNGETKNIQYYGLPSWIWKHS